MNPAQIVIMPDPPQDRVVLVVCRGCGGIVTDAEQFTLAEVERFASNHHCQSAPCSAQVQDTGPLY